MAKFYKKIKEILKKLFTINKIYAKIKMREVICYLSQVNHFERNCPYEDHDLRQTDDRPREP